MVEQLMMMKRRMLGKEMQLLTISPPMSKYGFGDRRLDRQGGCTYGEVLNGSKLEWVREQFFATSLMKKSTSKIMITMWPIKITKEVNPIFM